MGGTAYWRDGGRAGRCQSEPIWKAVVEQTGRMCRPWVNGTVRGYLTGSEFVQDQRGIEFQVGFAGGAEE